MSLILLPLRYGFDEIGVTHAPLELRFQDDRELFGQIPQGRPLPAEQHIQLIRGQQVYTDARGNSLTYVLAGELRQLAIPGHWPSWNHAIRGFIDGLPSDTPIVLYWT